ncbi:MAG: helix-turn-helix domain-containing protein [Chitinispirillaceae bacterium]|nr:helix-turn-helix domain-containing protein [Chitinispirillaceae bacterium]
MRHVLLFLPFFLFVQMTATAEPPVKIPDLQHLTRPRDTVKTDSLYLTTLDSARFVNPPPRTVLTGNRSTIRLLPRCPVDSVLIFVRHSFDNVDTLAHLSSPPYSTEWDFSSLPDQDQIHLQFGYRLFHPCGRIITSKPLPHQWVISRAVKKSRKKHHCRQIVPPDTVIVDGDLSEWKRTRMAPIGTAGRFAFRWTGVFLYFAAEVTTGTITPSDFIEVHLDPALTRGSFTDERHRSIRFGPRSRSFCIVACDTGSGYMQCDSIVSLLNEGLSWRVKTGGGGYTIEAAIPFFALSDQEFPQMRFGADVTIRSGTLPVSFVSWAGSTEYTRYNPGKWGTVVLRQAMLPLKIFIVASGILIGVICLVIVILLLRHLFNSERLEREEHTGGSEQLRAISGCIADRMTDRSLSLAEVARTTAMSTESIEAVLQRELECTFEQYLGFQRVNAAKQLLWDFDLPMDTIAKRCGFDNEEALREPFARQFHADPAVFRMKLKELSEEDEPEPDAPIQ